MHTILGSKKYTVSAIIILLTILVIATGYLVIREFNAEWKTHHNPFGYSFNHPEGSEVRKSRGSYLVYLHNGRPAIYINNYTTEQGQNFFSWFGNYKKEYIDPKPYGTAIYGFEGPNNIEGNVYQIEYFYQYNNAKTTETFFVRDSKVARFLIRQEPSKPTMFACKTEYFCFIEEVFMKNLEKSQHENLITSFRWAEDVVEANTENGRLSKNYFYTSDEYNGQKLRFPLPKHWLYQKYSKYISKDTPLNNSLRVELYNATEEKEWGWSETTYSDWIVIEFLEKPYSGLLVQHPTIQYYQDVERVENKSSVEIYKIENKLAMLIFPKNYVCIIKKENNKTDGDIVFSTILENLQIFE